MTDHDVLPYVALQHKTTGACEGETERVRVAKKPAVGRCKLCFGKLAYDLTDGQYVECDCYDA